MLEQLIFSVESGLKDLSRCLLQRDARDQMLEEMDRLNIQLQQRRDELARAQHELAGAKRRLRDTPTDAALLHSRIETLLQGGQADKAWNLALTLDLFRRALTDDQAACPGLEQRCWSLHFHIRQLQRRLDQLLEQLAAS